VKLGEIRERTDEELVRLVEQVETDLFKLRVQRHTSQLPNPMQLREARKTLARVLTVLGARRRGTEVAGAQPSRTAKKAEPAEAAPAEEPPKAEVEPEARAAAKAGTKAAKAKKAKPAKAAKADKPKKTAAKPSKPAARGKTEKARTGRGGK